MLTGDQHALIRREDFEITGDSVEFNTKTRYAVLRGKIRMVIQSANLEK
jgi:lipopolysaccharide export system protein LptA